MLGSVVVAGVVRHRRQNTVGRSEGEGQPLGSRRGTKGSRIKKTNEVGEIWRWIIGSSSVYRVNG